jgi:iron complex transport system substrate-binding protein
VVLVKPCGFDLPRTLNELKASSEVLAWRSWRAVAEGRVFVADGNAFFNRPGPRIVESLEIMAGCVHPEVFPEFVEKHRASAVRLTIEKAG